MSTRNNLFTTFTKLDICAISVLSIAPEEIKASTCKVVALIQLSKFDEAVKFIEKGKLSQSLVFEKAYSQYRLNKSSDALKTIEEANINPLPANLKELKAQILYRLENFDECFNLYKDIIKNSSDDYEEERTTNFSAVVANLSCAGSVSEICESQNTSHIILLWVLGQKASRSW